jgi:hypothetical protein
VRVGVWDLAVRRWPRVAARGSAAARCAGLASLNRATPRPQMSTWYTLT